MLRPWVFCTVLLAMVGISVARSCSVAKAYLILPTPEGTVEAQWTTLFGGISASYQWANAFEGVVILPPENEGTPKFSKVFNVIHLYSHLKSRGVNYCVASSGFMKRMSAAAKQVHLPPLDSGFAYTGEHLVAAARRKSDEMSSLSPPLVVWLPAPTKLPPPAGLDSFYRLGIEDYQQAVFAIKFTQKVVDLGSSGVHKVHGVSVAVHALEDCNTELSDWSPPHRPPTYRQALEGVCEGSPAAMHSVFLVCPHKTKAIRAALEDGGAVRQTVFVERRLDRLEPFELSAVEMQIASHAEHFIGSPKALWDLAVGHQRLAFGRPSFFIGITDRRSQQERNQRSFQPHVIDSLDYTRIAAPFAGGLSDKDDGHHYAMMYGLFLNPLVREWRAQRPERRIKFLEIGLGCDPGKGYYHATGSSVDLWKDTFGPNSVEIWEAEYNLTCAKEWQRISGHHDVKLLSGDQGKRPIVEGWVNATGGDFDVIVDDGGHVNIQIQTSFDVLFEKALRPGGLYFLEDLHVGRYEAWYPPGTPSTSEMMQAYIDQLLLWRMKTPPKDEHGLELFKRYPLPPTIKWIMCQAEACVVAKCEDTDLRKCRPGGMPR